MNPALRVELYAPGDCLLFGDDSAETYVNFLADSLEKLWSRGKSQNSEARTGGRNNETRGDTTLLHPPSCELFWQPGCTSASDRRSYVHSAGDRIVADLGCFNRMDPEPSLIFRQ